MNRIALGTVQFGQSYGIANKMGQVSRIEAKSMLRFATSAGIDTIDTAIAYGDSEACLGEAGAAEFKITTKLPRVPDYCLDVGAWVDDQVGASLSRLGVARVYGLLLHHPEQLLGPYGEPLYRALKILQENGRVQKVGISIYSPSELAALGSKYYFDLVQAPFNLIDQRLYKTGWMYRLHDGGVELHTRSTFLQGLLLMNESEIPDKFLPWANIFRAWHHWLGESNGLAMQACISFPLSFPEISRVVVGVDSASQLKKIANAVNGPLINEFPDLQCEDENLINPGRWSLAL